jgi:hypothetical protein
MSLLIYYLAKFPACQEKLFKEIVEMSLTAAEQDQLLVGEVTPRCHT